MTNVWLRGYAVVFGVVFVTEVSAQENVPQSEAGRRTTLAAIRPTQFELSPLMLAAAPATEETKSASEIAETDRKSPPQEWDIVGPIRLRSADPEPTGELELKNIFDYGTSSDGTDDDIEYKFEVEWGFAPNHELIFEVPVQMGDGGVDGNADIELGWHWRLWKEQDLLPAFAVRNYIRVPSGYHSSGVDYELRGLITKSIVPDKFRLHLNPFLKSVNGDNEEDHRYFQWGVIAGADYRVMDNLVLNVDYVHETSETNGHRNQHTLEVGADWHFAEHQSLGFVTRAGLDGDDDGENWGFAISYIYEFDAVPALGK